MYKSLEMEDTQIFISSNKTHSSNPIRTNPTPEGPATSNGNETLIINRNFSDKFLAAVLRSQVIFPLFLENRGGRTHNK